ncbi:hypothetical protein [Comamonas sp. A7-5]|uniref:hypothetical protein n=1 Tax=Comamonas sp. A7-5 TaxID=673549 RepID=UPI0031D5A270
MGLHPGLAQWGLTQRDDTFLMQCVPTIQNSTRNRADFFKSCTRLKDLAQLSKGVFIGKQAFFPGFLPCKKVALPHSFSGHHSRASCVESCVELVALRGLWHKFARSLAQSSTAFGTKADNLARDSTTNVLFLHQKIERLLAINV